MTFIVYEYTYKRVTRQKSKKEGGEKVKITTVMEEPLWKELRIQAIKEKTSAGEIIGRLVTDYLKKAKKRGIKLGL